MAFASNASTNETFATLAAPVATLAGTALQVLAYVPIPKNTLRRAGQGLRALAFGTCAANTNTKTFSLVIGPAALITAGSTAPTQAQMNTGAAAAGTAALLSASASSAASEEWYLKATIQRSATLVQYAMGESYVDDAATELKVSALTQDETTNLALYVCCTDGTDSAGDAILQGMIVEGLSD